RPPGDGALARERSRDSLDAPRRRPVLQGDRGRAGHRGERGPPTLPPGAGEAERLVAATAPRDRVSTMTEPSSVPDPDEAILIRFQQDDEASRAKEAVVRRYCELSPNLAARIRARVAMAPLLGRPEPGPVEPLPERFGEFRVVRRIGGGGMGQVYEARHDRLN